MNSQNQLMQSETLKNLMRAFAGESQARNRYTIAAAAAEEQNQHLLAEVFRFTARQEKEHAALLWQKMSAVSGQTIDICGGYPVETSQDLVRQLRSSVGNERSEAETVYPSFAKTAREEGFTAEAMLFEQLAKIERGHAERFERFADLASQQKLFSGGVQGWLCLNCGHLYEGESAPAQCPVCAHPQGYFIRSDLSPFRG